MCRLFWLECSFWPSQGSLNSTSNPCTHLMGFWETTQRNSRFGLKGKKVGLGCLCFSSWHPPPLLSSLRTVSVLGGWPSEKGGCQVCIHLTLLLIAVGHPFLQSFHCYIISLSLQYSPVSRNSLHCCLLMASSEIGEPINCLQKWLFENNGRTVKRCNGQCLFLGQCA